MLQESNRSTIHHFVDTTGRPRAVQGRMGAIPGRETEIGYPAITVVIKVNIDQLPSHRKGANKRRLITEDLEGDDLREDEDGPARCCRNRVNLMCKKPPTSAAERPGEWICQLQIWHPLFPGKGGKWKKDAYFVAGRGGKNSWVWVCCSRGTDQGGGRERV